MKHINRRQLLKLGIDSVKVGFGASIGLGVGYTLFNTPTEKYVRPEKAEFNPEPPGINPYKQWTLEKVLDDGSVELEDITSIITERLKELEALLKGTDVNFKPERYVDRHHHDAVISSNGSYFATKWIRTTYNDNEPVLRLLHEHDNSIEAWREGIIETYCLIDSNAEKIFLLPKFLPELEERGYSGPIDIKVLGVSDNGICSYVLHPRGKPEEPIAGVFADLPNGRIQPFFQEDQGVEWDFSNFWISSDGELARIMPDGHVLYFNTNDGSLVPGGYGVLEALSEDKQVAIFRRDSVPGSNSRFKSNYVVFDPRMVDGHYDMRKNFVTRHKSTSNGGLDYRISPNGDAYMSIHHVKRSRKMGLRWRDLVGLFRGSPKEYYRLIVNRRNGIRYEMSRPEVPRDKPLHNPYIILPGDMGQPHIADNGEVIVGRKRIPFFSRKVPQPVGQRPL